MDALRNALVCSSLGQRSRDVPLSIKVLDEAIVLYVKQTEPGGP